jgi:hypothetical protein
VSRRSGHPRAVGGALRWRRAGTPSARPRTGLPDARGSLHPAEGRSSPRPGDPAVETE